MQSCENRLKQYNCSANGLKAEIYSCKKLINGVYNFSKYFYTLKINYCECLTGAYEGANSELNFGRGASDVLFYFFLTRSFITHYFAI